MKLKRLTALVMIIALTSASFPAVAVAAQVAGPGPSQQAIQVTGLSVSGTVVQSDRKTPVANACLRLRNVDTNAILARSVSDRNGAFSFAVSGPGMYIVEAIDCANTGVLAVSDALNLAGLPRTTVVVLPSTATTSSFVSSTAFLVLSAASAAAITVFAVRAGSSTPAVSSPEQ